MLRLARLRRLSLLSGGLLIALYLGLLVGIVWPWGTGEVILPSWVHHVPDVGLVLLLLSQVVAAAGVRGWRRLSPLADLAVAVPVIVLVGGFLQVATVRFEIDRVVLPDGRVVMMTLEPGMTDTIFGLWETPRGWRWQPFQNAVSDITYSEDHSFTHDPRLVVTADGRHLLIRRGGIWTDCWTTETSPAKCLPRDNGVPDTRDEWLGRSERIAKVVGAGLSSP
ncbi:hypothetical protein [Methylobacterium sp. Leaf466]|uniref:hypothetical protein n=1 Tax=Methylobacterium sp. Leaf466 TaxID=1736386 RepID=UPI0006F3D074|nr:hypothetical protein [Methylobacterium sp. Leaf466]KQT80763.1 hypothetical protein ASG59_04905 [Methylobacterium sp. Leaf466]